LVPARSAGTIYHVHVMLDGTQPAWLEQIFNNHIPLESADFQRLGRHLQDPRR